MIKSKLIYLAFSALLLIGCSGVTSNVILQLQPDKDYKFNYSLSPAPQVEVPDEVLGTMRNEIQKGLSEQNLLASKGDDKFYKADVLITHYRMRPDAARLLVGIMAGCDKINSKLTIVDSNTTKTIGQAEFESNECAAWGVASQVIKAHIKKIVDYLSSLSADSPLSAPVSVTAPELVTKATPEQGETIKPGGINTDGRFIAYGDGTVLDTKTNLMWAAKDNRADVTWQEAKNYCENYRGGGYTDWRMPMQNELAGLYNKYKPRPMACDTSYTNRLETALIDISCYYLWASETESSFFRSTSACFSFFDGQRAFFRQSYNGYMRVLPVRSVKDVSKSILKSKSFA